MKRKKNEAHARMARILAQNVRKRMAARYRTAKSESAMIRELSAESGVGRSTIQRVINPEKYGLHRTTMDKLIGLAMALRCETHELLIEESAEEPQKH